MLCIANKLLGLTVSKSPTPFSFLRMACFHRNLRVHLHCCFYRMATVQCKQHNLWKVGVYLQSSFFSLKALLKFFLITLDWNLFQKPICSLSPAAAGSAVSGKQVSDLVTPVSNMGTLSDGGSASLLTTSNQTSLSGLGHSEDMPPSTMPPPQHNK